MAASFIRKAEDVVGIRKVLSFSSSCAALSLCRKVMSLRRPLSCCPCMRPVIEHVCFGTSAVELHTFSMHTCWAMLREVASDNGSLPDA